MELQQGLQYLNHKTNHTNKVRINSNLNFSNTNVESNNEQFNIGKSTNKIMNTISNFIGINNLEGFRDNKQSFPVEEKNKHELNEIRRLENKLNKLISDYSTTHQQLMSDAKEYLESSEGANKYSGKNIKLPNNDKFFITDNGYHKAYPNDEIYDKTVG